MFSQIVRFKQIIALGALTFALLVAGSAPLLGGDAVDAAKKGKKAKTPNIAIQSISLEEHADVGHKTVVVDVANIGKKNANGFRISMSAQNQDGQVRPIEYSLPLNLAKGASTEVEFRLGCNWINFGAVTVSTDPSPVQGELPSKTANNSLSQSYGLECLISIPPIPLP
jgi:hypothetical protein